MDMKTNFTVTSEHIAQFLPLLNKKEEGPQRQVLTQLARDTKYDLHLCYTVVSNSQIISSLVNIFRSDLKSDLSLLAAKTIRNLVLNTKEIPTNSSSWKSCVNICAAKILQPVDNTIQKSAALLVSELTRNNKYATQFIQEVADLNLLIRQGLTSSDDELLHWILQIVRNILILSHGNSFDLTIFNAAILQTLYRSEYPAIAHVSLDITRLLLNDPDSKEFLEHFTQTGAFHQLIELLNSSDFQDIHSSIFEVLSCLVRFPTTSFTITESELQSLVTYVESFPDNELVAKALSWLVDVAANLSDMRKLMSDNKIADLILKCIHDEDCRLVGHGCSLICHLILDDVTFASLKEKEDHVLSILFCIVHNGGKICQWDIRVKAALALRTLVICDDHICDKFAIINRKDDLRDYLEEVVSDEVPQDMISTVLSILNWVYNKDKHLHALPYHHFYKLMQCLLYQLKFKNSEIQLEAATLFSTCMRDQNHLARRFLVDEDPLELVAIFYELFTNGSPELEAQAIYGRIIRDLMSSHTIFVDAVISHGILHSLITQAKLHPISPASNQMLNAIFQNNLSAKFAYTNKLEATDKITPGFYFLRNRYTPREKFKTLEELKSSFKVDSSNVVYEIKSFGSLLRPVNQNIDKTILDSKSTTMSPENLIELLADRVLEKFFMKHQIHQYTSSLYEFHTFHLYLCELMVQLKSPIIPFEVLQCGLELECSVLFKLFCDHMAIPCSLHRGSNVREDSTRVYFNDTDCFIVKFSQISLENFKFRYYSYEKIKR